jgi:hypothetical protein
MSVTPPSMTYSSHKTYFLRSASTVGAAAAALLVTLAASSSASAAPSKEQCITSHGNGQDLRGRGQLAQARQEFLSCAQASCPSLIQSDCARFSEELGRMVPTVTFAARDSSGTDISDTQVFVDDKLVAQRLEGKMYELDPGKHVIKWVHQGKESTEAVVLNQGEQGREIIATFGGPPPVPGQEGGGAKEAPSPPEPHKSLLPFVVVGAGAAAVATGAVLLGVGLGKVPSNCSLSSNTCTAAAGDPVFNTAHNGVVLADVGMGVGIVGLAAVAGGIIWYAVEPAKVEEKTAPTTGKLLGPITPTPWFDGKSGGLGLRATF